MTPLVCINPQIVAAAYHMAVADEGCLSIPGVLASVSRPDWIVLRWTDLTGEACERRFDGLEGRCVQHEFDHLDGRVTFDRLDAQDRAALEAAYRA